jgi:hypothetical protein
VRLAYDREADALYIRLIEGAHQCRNVRLTDDIALDFAAGGAPPLPGVGFGQRMPQPAGPFN